ncbi:hypothetical protein MHK_002319, partial [Candidatus Magnetomorum sp. HK-1]
MSQSKTTNISNDDILIPPHAYYHLLWAIHLLSKKID